MIKSVEFTNFRSYVSRKFAFGPGLNVIRGPNERGKTTLMEGVCYCLFGSDALTDPIADVINWDAERSFMKVITELDHQGKDYRCVRSTAGAEVYVGGDSKPVCTGQKEVTKFMENLFGMPTKTSHLLLLAQQNDIRGILEGKEPHTFIEKLANFEEIDQLIDLIQTKLSTGAVGPSKLALESAQAELDNMPVPELVQPLELTREKATLQQHKEQAESLKQQEAGLRQKLTATQKANNDYTQAKHALDLKEQSLQQKQADLADIRFTEPDEADKKRLNERAQDFARRQAAYVSYLSYQELPTYPEEFWEGDHDSFTVEKVAAEKKVEAREKKIQDLKTEIKVAQSHIITDLVCKSCNRTFDNAAEIERHNSAKQKDIDTLNVKLEAEEQKYNEELCYSATLQNLANLHEVYEDWLEDCPSSVLIHANKHQVPVLFLWSGPIPTRPEDAEIVKIEKELKAWEAAAVVARNSRERKERLEKEVASLKTQVEAAKAALAALVWTDTAPISQQITEVSTKLEAEVKARDNLADQLRQKESAHQLSVNAYNNQLENIEKAKKRVAAAKAAMTDLEENNALLKAVRTARVQVTDHIWNLVLKVMSSGSTKLRGEEAVLTKDEKGFKCNGKPVKSYSGSTRDVMGLATRFALAKMFLPGLDFQGLDEPAANCDQFRSENVLSYIKTAGFSQIFLSTHRDADESGADVLIEP